MLGILLRKGRKDCVQDFERNRGARLLDKPVNLIALTPGTSFDSASTEGAVEERVILFRMLEQAWGDLGYDARKVFLGELARVWESRYVHTLSDPQDHYVSRLLPSMGLCCLHPHRRNLGRVDHHTTPRRQRGAQ